jgi:hypothetical protein
MATRNVRIVGLKELEAKCDFDVLVQPEMEDARDTFLGRINRQGKGLGAQRNQLSATVQGLGATVESTLNYPRTKGTKWGQKNERVVAAMAPRVIKKAISRIEARWAAGNPGSVD